MEAKGVRIAIDITQGVWSIISPPTLAKD